MSKFSWHLTTRLVFEWYEEITTLSSIEIIGYYLQSLQLKSAVDGCGVQACNHIYEEVEAGGLPIWDYLWLHVS